MLRRKDNRIKGCWNPKCSRCRKHYKYTAKDRYCSLCRSELVFVCSKCGGLLEDEGRKHTVCGKCLANRKANAENRREAVASVIGAVGAVGSVVADRFSEKASKTESKGNEKK